LKIGKSYKSQGGVEFTLILMMLLGLTVFVLANAFHEDELTVAIATARNAGEGIALRDNTLLLRIEYNASQGDAYIQPVFADGLDRSAEVLGKIKNVLAPRADYYNQTCFKTTRLVCTG